MWNEPERNSGGRQFTDRIEGQEHTILIGYVGPTAATWRSERLECLFAWKCA